ncbi:hypothetical protein CTZ28_03980 [Streptomyces shenzhenensis]|uniref:Uncharacterized protein n=1 Tax=Streptomyces shenzhenensis TaxID=943815 RepID=A0A3M0IDG9_9ACTN|nr:hypothetical protein CTZ28_03980 [Streptomyces shenzhenensis]
MPPRRRAPKRAGTIGIGHYGWRSGQARWAAEQYTSRTRRVQREVGRAIKVRNAHEMVLWWDAQVPDRLRWHRGEAA